MDINDNNFESEVIEKSKELPVLVDFWATWCAPCMMLKPILEKVAKDLDGKFILAKVNVDESPVKSGEFDINAIPSVKLFKDGKVSAEFTGLKPEEALKQWINENL